jgi:hypothetical protein
VPPGILADVRRAFEKYDRGLHDQVSLERELENAFNAAERDDPETAEALRVVLASTDLTADLFSSLLGATRFRRVGRPAPAPDLHRDAFVSLVERVRIEDRAERAALLASRLPPEWCTPELARFAAAAELTPDDRRDADRALLRTVLTHDGAEAAFAQLVEPHLEEGEHALGLLVHAFLEPRLAHRDRVLAVILRDAGAVEVDDIVRVAVRLAIDGDDAGAMRLARRIAERTDLRARHPAVLALIVWLGGDRAGAIPLLDLPARHPDESGWYTQLARVIPSFFAAVDAEPAEVMAQLTVPRGEHEGSSIRGVGALVGRMAYQRMRASLALGDVGRAGWEATAVIAYHGYRAYELHAQGWGYEFDPDLVLRLAVTPAELAEAEALVRDHAPNAEAPHLSEGMLRLRKW